VETEILKILINIRKHISVIGSDTYFLNDKIRKTYQD